MTEKALLALVTDSQGQVFAHMDKRGVDLLIARLQRIRYDLEAGDCPHAHLFSEEWTSPQCAELTMSTMMNTHAEGQPVHHFKLFGWTDEWTERHGLYETPDTN